MMLWTRTALSARDPEGSCQPRRGGISRVSRSRFFRQWNASPSDPARTEAGPYRRLQWPVLLAGLCFLLAFASAAPQSQAQGLGDRLRVVQGKVLDSGDKPQPGAIVYLQNQKTQEIRTYITVADGSYRFGQLSGDVDYRLWAKLQESKSKTRTISSFDSKKQFTFDLKLEPAK